LYVTNASNEEGNSVKKAILTMGVIAAVIVPAVAIGSPQTSAEKQCRAERTAMGTATFKLTYGTNANRSNAFGKCVSQHTKTNTHIEANAKSSAKNACTTEQAADPAAFDQKYGTGPQHKNAFGKCVSQTAKAKADAAEQANQQAEVNAARTCKAERASLGATAFADKYGTNHNKRNAFGKCVSQHAKAQS
jgi:hypothetical protein